MQRGGRNAERDEPLHLVAHERDEGRHDQGEGWKDERRQLVKQGFARAGGKDRKDVVPVENGADDLGLSRSETLVAEPIAQEALRFLQISATAFSHETNLAPGRRVARGISRRGAATDRSPDYRQRSRPP